MLTRTLLTLVRLYQRFLSPLTGDCCRFEPTCSRYACLCLEHHGAWRGGWLTLKRLARCNPFCGGGIDLPPLPENAPPSHRQLDWSRLARRIESQAGIGALLPDLAARRAELNPPVSAPKRDGAYRS